ncbi:MAG: hypothetical protein E7348_01400 [Clostridiales bacterium]|nr:hypothetical protein [Clostridiales bacterium]
MQYEKKFLTLKSIKNPTYQKPFTLLACIEIENGKANFSLSASGFFAISKTQYYALMIDGDKNQFEFDLSQNPHFFNAPFLSVPNLKKGFSIGFYSVQNFIPLTLAFGAQGRENLDISQFNKLLADKFLDKFSCQNRLETDFSPNNAPAPPLNENFSQYDDEAVATQNYYELDQEINEKLMTIKEKLNEDIPIEDALFENSNRAQAQENCTGDTACQNEANASFCKENLDTEPYYLQVKSQLDQIFACYPEEQTLTNLYKDSKWAKINYSNDKYYVVGLVDFDNEQKFICYGVPGRYSIHPPEQLKGYASFVPKSLFDTHGDGFWIMFQDAVSGNCVHLD